jgi:hypothetical protein
MEFTLAPDGAKFALDGRAASGFTEIGIILPRSVVFLAEGRCGEC